MKIVPVDTSLLPGTRPIDAAGRLDPGPGRTFTHEAHKRAMALVDILCMGSQRSQLLSPELL